MAIDRKLKEVPIAQIKVDTPYYTGVTQVICLRDSLFDLVIGNIFGALNPDDSVPGGKHVPLRLRELKLERMPPSNL